MNARGIAVLAAVGLLGLPALASAGWTPRLTASDVRVGNHPAYVRVVVDFTGGVLAGNQVEAKPFESRGTRVRVSAPGISSQATERTAYHVRVRVIHGAGHLRIQMDYNGGFKYLSYTVLPGNRLVIDLWKSAPPTRFGEFRSAPSGCLSLRQLDISRGTVTARGTAHGIFENAFRVVLRGADGKVLGRRLSVHGPSWRATVPYKASHRQAGTLEAVDFSAKDGALSCIVQARVSLPAS